MVPCPRNSFPWPLALVPPRAYFGRRAPFRPLVGVMLPRDRERLLLHIRARLFDLLAAVVEPPLRRCHTLHAHGRTVSCTLRLGPRDEEEARRDHPALPLSAGLWFSPLEHAIWVAVGADTLQAKQIAAKVGQVCTSSFRTILANLVARGVLVNVAHDGYRRMPEGADSHL